MLSTLIKIIAASLAVSAFAASGKLQNDDFATSASILAAGGSLNQLLNTSKIWDSSHSQLLDTTLANIGGSGTVTSVAQTVPSFLSVAGSPITTAGTLAITLATQSANTVFAGPTGGSATSPSFRALVSADIPALPYQTSGSYLTALTGDVTATGPGSAAATLATVNGNVGTFGSASNSLSVTANAKGLITAISTNSIAISQSQVTNLVADLAAKGTGSVTSVNLTAPGIFSVSGVPITGSGTIAITNSIQSANTVWAGPTSGGATSPSFRVLVSADIPAISLASGVNNILPIANGGTAASVALSAFNNLSPLTTSGDVLVYNGGNNARKAVGTNGQVLTADNTVTGGIKWATPSATSGDVSIGGSGARLERATIAGDTRNNDCDVTHCNLFDNSGGISSVTRSGTGRAKITLTSTSCTTAWSCNMNAFDPGGGGGQLVCNREDAVNGAPSTTNWAFHCVTTADADSDFNMAITCTCLK